MKIRNRVFIAFFLFSTILIMVNYFVQSQLLTNYRDQQIIGYYNEAQAIKEMFPSSSFSDIQAVFNEHEDAIFIVSHPKYFYTSDDDFRFISTNPTKGLTVQSFNEFVNVELDQGSPITVQTIESINSISYSFFTQTKNDVKYFVMIFYSINSLDETLSVVRSTYLYLYLAMISVSFILAVILSNYFSAPLIKMSRVARKLSQLDFEEKCDVSRRDEYGVLAKDINTMSSNLEKSLQELHDDIERERRIDKDRKEFIGTISHEMKTPLTIIRGILEGTKHKVGKYKDPYAYLDTLLNEVDYMDSMVKDLLNIIKIEEQEINITSFNIRKIIEESVRTYSHLLEEKNFAVKMNVKDIEVYGDINKIDLVIKNALSNAIKYSPVDEIIFIKTKKVNDRCIVEIENTGVNIPAADIDEIWKSFYRVEKSRNRESGGTGLGLSIIQGILKSHESKFGIKNSGKNVLFHFDLPIKKI